MQHPSVKKLFDEQSRYYSIPEQSAVESPLIPIFLEWTKDRPKSQKIKVCEFGGAGGILLNNIRQKTKANIIFYNAEIVGKYRKYQVSPKIKFCVDSILNSKFSDNYFDCIIIRDVLHHLIGKNFKETRKNQNKALREIKKLIKPDGIILIEELVERHALVARIIYYLSKINSKIGIRSSLLEISPFTIVAFLTMKELHLMITKNFGPNKIVKQIYNPVYKLWQERLVHLGFSSGKLILVLKP